MSMFEPLLPGQKPVGPVEIDWSHPLSEGVSHFLLFQHGEVHDLVTGRPCTKGGGTKWTPEGQYFDESGDYLTLADVEWNNNFSILTHIDFEDNNGTLYQYFLSTGSFGGADTINWYLNEIGNELRIFDSDTGNPNVLNGYWPTYNDIPLAVTVSGTTVNQYVNGIKRDDSGAWTTGVSDGSVKTLYIAARGDLEASRMTGGWFKYVIVYGGRTLSADEVASMQRNPYQFLRPVSRPQLIINTQPTPLTYEYTVPDPKWEEPALLAGKKPTGPVVIDWENSLTANLSALYLPQGNGGVLDLVANELINDANNPDLAYGPTHGMAGNYNGSSEKILLENSDIGFFASSPGGKYTAIVVTSFTGTPGTEWIFSAGRSTDTNPISGISRVDDNIRIYSRGDAGTLHYNTLGSTAVNDGKPHVVVLTFDRGSSGSAQVYVDGTLEIDENILATDPATMDRLTLGALTRSTVSNYFSGQIYLAGYFEGVKLTPGQAVSLSRNPYQILCPS